MRILRFKRHFESLESRFLAGMDDAVTFESQIPDPGVLQWLTSHRLDWVPPKLSHIQ